MSITAFLKEHHVTSKHLVLGGVALLCGYEWWKSRRREEYEHHVMLETGLPGVPFVAEPVIYGRGGHHHHRGLR